MFNETMSEYGLTLSQASVLFLICDSDEPITQRDIKNQLGVAHTTVLGIIKRLEKNGYVTTVTNENDKRSTLLLPTEKALKVHDIMKQGAEERGNSLLSGFSPDEFDMLVFLLRKLHKNLVKNI